MNISIRPLSSADAEASHRWRLDSELWKFTGAAGRPPASLEMERQWIERSATDPSCRRFAVEADGKHVGNVSLTGISAESCDYHIVIGDRDYWGKGVAHVATQRALAYAWKELGLRSVTLSVNPENLPALRIYERLGFEPLGMDPPFQRMILHRPSFIPRG